MLQDIYMQVDATEEFRGVAAASGSLVSTQVAIVSTRVETGFAVIGLKPVWSRQPSPRPMIVAGVSSAIPDGMAWTRRGLCRTDPLPALRPRKVGPASVIHNRTG